MGVDIYGISKAKYVACQGDDEDCDETHYTVFAYPKRRDGLKLGCYVIGKGGRSCYVRFSYGGYDAWIRQLSRLALGVEPEEVWQHTRRFRDKPFVELIDFPDATDGTIGPITSAKLHDDFVALASAARTHYAKHCVTRPRPSRFKKRPVAKDKPRFNRAGLSAALGLAQALGGTVTGSEEGEDLGWMWKSYRDFRRAFKLAQDGGFVLFS